MQSDQIFVAASFSDIMKQLLAHNPSGILTIWPAGGPRQDELHITIEHGRPMVARRGRYEEYISASTLFWINSWGSLHFTFHLKTTPAQLPPPGASELRLPAVTRPLPAITRPLPAVTAPSHTSDEPAVPVPAKKNGHVLENKAAYSIHSPNPPETPAPGQSLIPAITAQGRTVPLHSIPRYDRTVLLLINGRRTIADLAGLTRRGQADIYGSLSRLEKQQLITLH